MKSGLGAVETSRSDENGACLVDKVRIWLFEGV